MSQAAHQLLSPGGIWNGLIVLQFSFAIGFRPTDSALQLGGRGHREVCDLRSPGLSWAECVGQVAFPNTVLAHHRRAIHRDLEKLGKLAILIRARCMAILADRLNDKRARTYSLVSAIHVSTHIAPYSLEVFEALSREITEEASIMDDAYLQYFWRGVEMWEEIFRGRMARARQATEEMMATGQRMNDPRPTGFAMQNQAWIRLWTWPLPPTT
jgi:hypothetical protein